MTEVTARLAIVPTSAAPRSLSVVAEDGIGCAPRPGGDARRRRRGCRVRLVGGRSGAVVGARPGRSRRIVGIGVATAGPIDLVAGTVSPVNIPGWRNFPIVDRVPAGVCARCQRRAGAPGG